MALAARELEQGAKPAISAELAERAAPVSLAGDQRLPVLAPLEPLLPDRGLRRGSVVAVEGSSALALALAAGASRAGSWCGAVGRPPLGVVAAAELGIVLERFPLVPAPDPSATGPGGWAWVVATLLDALDLVIAWPLASVRPADARRLAARARERGAVLVVASGGWPEAPDIRLTITRSEWVGAEAGNGRLRARRVEVVGGGRRAASGERRATLWLPGPGGGVAAAGGGGGGGRLRDVG
ncbi:MAG: hypothetical protein QOG43_3574 [Actinomycetota bacterium]|nr:hypothetical protein [Actinomycetota bacterium]